MTTADKKANEKILRDTFRTMDPHQAKRSARPTTKRSRGFAPWPTHSRSPTHSNRKRPARF